MAKLGSEHCTRHVLLHSPQRGMMVDVYRPAELRSPRNFQPMLRSIHIEIACVNTARWLQFVFQPPGLNQALERDDFGTFENITAAGSGQPA